MGSRFLFLFSVILPLLWGAPASAFDEVNTGYFNDLALQGFDSAHYFTSKSSQKGSGNFTYEWKGAHWRFANRESLKLFASNPDKYAPQYGGYCSNQMSLGNLSDIDPGVWLIFQEKLYFFGHQEGLDRWNATGIAARIKDADTQWLRYLAQN